MSDIRHALRVLKSSPSFTLAALAVLSLGIGANSAMFAVLDAVLVRPLPVAQPDRLVALVTAEPGGDESDYGFSYPGFKDLRDGVQAFSGMLASSGFRASVSHAGQNQRVYGEVVTGGYFTTLGVRPFLGRLLTPEDDGAIGAQPVVVLDHAFWQRLGGDPGLVGRDLLVNGKPLTVVGVTPREFYGTDLSVRPALRVPMAMSPVLRPNISDPTLSHRNHRWLKVMARLRPGVSAEQAAVPASAAFANGNRLQLEEMSPSVPASARARVEGRVVRLVPGAQGTALMQRQARLPILLLGAATIAVLVIACANLANLLLARGASRSRELAVRAALGGSRWRVVRQLVAENLVLSTLAGLLGLIVSFWMTGVLLRYLPGGNALGTDLVPDARGVAATFLLSLTSGLLFGIVPAIRSVSRDPAADLRCGGPTMAAGERLFGTRSLLIVAQVAMSFALLVGAGLFLRTLHNLNRVETGFVRDHVLVATLDPGLEGRTGARAAALLAEFAKRVQALPGVRSAGLSSVSPITGSWDVNSISVPGYRPASDEEPDTSFAAVSPGYLETMGIVPKQGRTLSWSDVAGAPVVAVINETMSRQYFDGAAVGRHFSITGSPAVDVEVVGVVPDGKYVDLREAHTPRFAYVSFLQAPLSGSELTLHARTDGEPLQYVDAVKARLRELDPTLPLSGVGTLEEQIAESLSFERVLATLGSAFGLVALSLAAVGVYGVFAFSVARRTREMGLRLALGARPDRLAASIVRRAAVLLALGLAAGIAGASAFQGLVRSLLFGVAPFDIFVILGASALVMAIGVLAAWLPARRVARLDPLVALRQE
jgi:predicted permease